MLLPFWHRAITRIRPGEKTERGSTVPDWENVKRLDITECLVNPTDTSLSQDGRVLGVQDGITVNIPADADVKPGDRIEIDGNVYTINGDPMVWGNVGMLSHMQLNLRRWRG